MFSDQTDCEFFGRITRSRCIQVIPETTGRYIGYHKLDQRRCQEQKNAEFVIDYIVEKASFPNGRWQDPYTI